MVIANADPVEDLMVCEIRQTRTTYSLNPLAIPP
ncbi:hypothetical protein TcasGA2_TC016142 [Tribolium castaneum]|uniref:Uncharacterized protein n=1 Tax=Tribolium castaneum TaxID=7070 RepID=D7GY14_TRICA|nr:hypothetical protein TcasGA2_TC016142 [Tribolium castaneum]